MLVKKTVLEETFESSSGEQWGISFSQCACRNPSKVDLGIFIGDCHKSISLDVGYIREFADMLLQEFDNQDVK